MISNEKSTIVFYGNCQIAGVHNLLSSIPELNAEYDFGFGTSVHSEKGVPNYNDVPEEQLTRCSYMIEQIVEPGTGGRFIPFQQHKKLPRTATHIRVPALNGSIFWPTFGHDPRNLNCPTYNGKGPYPMGDSLIFKMLTPERDPDMVAAAYIDTDLRKVIDVARVYEIWDYHGREHEKSTDLKMHSYIVSKLKNIPLYCTARHPNAALIVAYADLVLNSLGLQCLTFEETASRFDYPPLTEYEFPIHPTIATALGLNWVTPQTTYRHYHNGSFTFPHFIHRYARFVG